MIVAGPVNTAVSMADARTAARINGADQDAELEICVRALTAEAEHATGRSIINRTFRVTMDAFGGSIELPVRPVQSVAIKYRDPGGVEQTLDPQDYILDNISAPCIIVLAPGKAWPATLARINSVTVDVVCGYGPDHTTTPAAFKGYILAKVREYFAPAGTPESPHLVRMLDSLKRY